MTLVAEGGLGGATGRRRAVFLDRDGTLNATSVDADGIPHPPDDLNQLEILPGVPQALDQLRQAGLLLVVFTNQPDVARGTQTRARVEAINASLCARLALDEVLCCYHDDADGCTCRKPLPGMILDASRRHGLVPTQSFVVGDRWRDIEAGRRAGCTTILLLQGHSEAELSKPDYEALDLPGAVDIILRCLMEPLT